GAGGKRSHYADQRCSNVGRLGECKVICDTGETPVLQMRTILLIFLVCVAAANAEMPRYETKYYILYTDVPPEQAQEAALRMSRMAEEYHNRTRDFSGAVRTKFPFYLFQHREDYLTARGLTGTQGMFNGTALYAVAGERLSDRT